MACSRSEREMMPLTTSALSTRTRRWTCNEQGNNKLRQGGASHCSYYTLLYVHVVSIFECTHLSFDNSLNDGVHGFIEKARDDSLNESHASANGLLHGYVQVVICPLGGQILTWRKNGTLWASRIWNEPTLVRHTYNYIKSRVKSHHFS